MKTINSTNILTAFLLALLLGCSCSRDREPSPDENPDDGMVRLILRMSVNAGGSRVNDKASRAGEIDFEGPYEGPDKIWKWEGVKTLRIIIVRPESNDLVEYNRLIPFPENEQIWNDSKTYGYDVVGGEYKRIYLIGNEESLGEENIGLIRSIEEGSQLPSEIGGMLLNSANGNPYITNTAETNSYIPLSEVFEVKVKDAVAGGSVTDEAYLFLTRALSKFSFTVDSDPTDVFSEHGLHISSIKISGMSDRQWVFPHHTIYSPGKYEISNNPLNGRLITSFATPDGTTTYEHTFTPASFGIKGKTSNTELTDAYIPLEYYLESPANGFTITVTATSNGLEREFEAPLPNLPRMPRNTHTRVHLTFKGETMEAEVSVVPYIGIYLDPIFGYGENGETIVKPPKPRE